MNKLRNALIVAGLLLCLGYTSNGQELIIRARPPIPHYVRVAPPSPRHVWIDEEWEPRGGTYVFVGGHWAMPPHPGWHWMPGHWDQRPRGQVWIPGRWRR
jgi:WXXGXW repeat (2 copies)